MELNDSSDHLTINEAPRPEVSEAIDHELEIGIDDEYEQKLDERARAAVDEKDLAVDGTAAATRTETRKPAAAAAGAPAAPEPGDGAETPEIGERSGAPETHHVRLLAKTTDNGQEVIHSRPEKEKIFAAVRNEEDQTLTITRDVAGGRVKFDATDSLIPKDARTTANTPSDQSPSKFTAWARIIPERHMPAAVEQMQKGGQAAQVKGDGGLDIAGFLSQYSGSFQVVVKAESVDPETRSLMQKEVGDALGYAAGTASLKEQAGKLAAFQSELTDAEQSGLVRREFVIGAENAAELQKLARLFASTGMASGDATTWSETSKTQPRFQAYKTAEEAMQAGESDANSYVSADRFSNEVNYPTTPVPGLDSEYVERFSANRTVAEDIRSVPVARILDNSPEPRDAGELRISDADLKRHTLIMASSGAGKTYLIRNIVSNVIKEDYDHSLSAEGGPDSRRAVVIVDFEKFGNYTGKLSEQMTGMGLPEDVAKIHRICPGEDEIRANINLLRLTGTTPAEQAAIAVSALCGSMEDPQAVRVFSKFASAAIERAYTKLGWNMATDSSDYPNDTPPIPDMDMVAATVEEVLAESTFRSETKGDLGSFTKSTLEDALRGIPGQLFQGGYDVDWSKVIEPGTITVIELGKITDMDAKRVAMTAIFRGLTSALRADNPEGGDIDETKLLLVQDETGGIYSRNTATGRDNAHNYTNVRGIGMEVVTAVQGKFDDLDSDVIDNTSNFFGLQLNNPRDRAVAAARMGIDVPRFMGNVTPGRGLYYGNNMSSGPLRFEVPDARRLPRGPSNVVDAKGLFDLGYDDKFYSGRVKALANDLLKNTEIGGLIKALAEANTELKTDNRQIGELSESLIERLKTMPSVPADLREDVRDSAICTAVKRAVFSRKDIMHAMKHRDLVTFIRDDFLAQARGDERPQVGPNELQFESARYNAVKDKIVAATTAPRLTDTPVYRNAFGQKIGGATSEEQLTNLGKLEVRAAASLAAIVGAQESLNDEQAAPAVKEFQRLTGKMPLQQVGDHVRTTLETQLGHNLTKQEEAVLAEIAGRYYNAHPEGALGYPDMRRALRQTIEEYKYRTAIDLTDEEEALGVGFGGGLALHQLERAVEAQEKLPKTYEVSQSNMLFAPDLTGPGTTLDNIVAGFVGRQGAQGAIHEQQRRLHNAGQEPNYSLVHSLHRGDVASADEWGNQLGVKVLMGPHFIFSLPSTIHLRRQAADHIADLKENNKRLAANKK